MTERLYNISKDQNETSNGLLNDIRKRSSLNRMYEKQSLALKKKLVEERKKAYDAASRKEGEGKGGLGFLRDLFLLKFLRGRGGGGFGRGGGRPPVGPTGGGLGISPRITPKNNIVPFNKPRIGTPRVGALAILGTGIDFTSRLGGGQNILQAGLGAGGGLAGALAGAKYGAIAGSFAGPVGTLIGGVGGSIIGGLAGGSIADLLSGANRRRGEELERVTLMSRKTEFSKASDDFDVVLDKFEGDTAPMLKSMKSEEDGGGELPYVPMMDVPTTKPQGPGVGKIIRNIMGFLIAEAVISTVLAFIPIVGPPAAMLRMANIARRFNKIVPFIRAVKKIKRFVPAKSLVGRLVTNKFLKASRVKLLTRKKSVLFPERQISIPKIPMQRIRTTAAKRTGPIIRKNNLNSFTKKRVEFDATLDPLRRRNPGEDILGDILRQNPMVKKQYQNNVIDSVLKGEEGLTKITLENIKQGVRNTKKGQDPQVLQRIVDGLKREGKIDVNSATIINPKGDFPIPPTRQEGGRVEAGRPYIVGEIGKELFVPDASGDIIPNEDLPSSNLLVINREPETVIVPQIIDTSSDTPIASNTVNPYDVVAKYAQMTGLFTV